MKARWLVVIGWTGLAVACGARTGLLAPEEPADVSVDVKHEHDAHPDVIDEDVVDVVFPDVPIVSDCPDAGDTLVYVLGAQNELYSFYPPTLTFKSIGVIACPGQSTPNSMAVTRSGIAFTNFLDGNLFEVSTANAACKATTYKANQGGFMTYGMGYAGVADGGETLFVSPNGKQQSQGLADIDTTAFTINFIAQFQPAQFPCELTGTGSGQLFGFCPNNNGSGSVLVEINPANAKIISSTVLNVGNNQSFAFAFWGGDFWIFTGNGDSTVTQYDPISKKETIATVAPIEIVGAGVSTCAPL